MRQVSIIVLLIFTIFAGTILPSFCAVKGGIEYSIPVDYSKINEQETELKARRYFYNAERLNDGIINDDMTNALMLYTVLQQVNPENTEYPIKLGILYDKINKDRQAKGCYFRAIGLDKSSPKPYFYLGEFYYKRELYRRALKYYNESYKLGMSTNYDLLYKMGDIYEKFGDTRSALKYLQEAQAQSVNPELENKIRKIESQDAINKEYYSDTRIRG